MQLIPLKDLDSKKEFWRGTRIRLMNHGDMHPDDKFFDYQLTELPDDKDHMILVNITDGSHKAGAIYNGKVPIATEANRRVTKLQDLKNVLGRDYDHCYLIEIED